MRIFPIFTTTEYEEAIKFLKKKSAVHHVVFEDWYASPNNEVFHLVHRKNKAKNSDDFAIYQVEGAARKDGYYVLNINNTSYMRHRFIMECFNGAKPAGMEIDHFDGNKSNNKLSNLMYVTHTENMRRYWRRRNEQSRKTLKI